MKQTLRKFFNNEAFILLIAIYAFINWIFKFDYHVTIIFATILIALITFTSTDSKPFIPVLLSVLVCDIFASKKTAINMQPDVNKINTIFIAILLGINILFFIYFYFKNKNNLHNKSLLNFSLILIGCSFLLTDLFIKKSFNFLIYFTIVLAIYFIKRTNNEYTIKSNFMPYFLKTLYYFGILMASQIFYVFIKGFIDTGHIVEPMIGWSISNNVSLILLLIIPICNYLVYKEDNKVYIIGIIYMLLANICTLSRGGVLAMVILIPGLLIANYKFSDNKKNYLRWLALGLCIFIICTIPFIPVFKDVINYLTKDGTSTSGRDVLWKNAINQFKNSPFLGGGSVLLPNMSNSKTWFHSTFFDILGQLGIVGLVTFGTHFFIKYKTCLTNTSKYKWFVFIGFISSGFYALMDVAYFHTNYLIFYGLVLASLVLFEHNKKETI